MAEVAGGPVQLLLLGAEISPPLPGPRGGPATSTSQGIERTVAALDERIQEVGYCGNWWEYRLPGRGQLDWRQFMGDLAGDLRYTGFISIEHEDTEFGWPNGPAELRKEGLLRGLATLRESLA